MSGSVLDKRYSKVGRAMSCIAKLDSAVHNPVYGFRVEFREPAIPPTSTLIIKVSSDCLFKPIDSCYGSNL